MTPQSRLFLLVPFLMMVSCSAPPPAGKLIHGKLRPCPDKPNCVSSETGIPDNKRVPPLAYGGKASIAMQQLQKILTILKGEFLCKEEEYIWVIFRSKLFKFIDDVEIRLDRSHNLIHIRSGARTGHSDMGVNKKRVQKITKEFETIQND